MNKTRINMAFEWIKKYHKNGLYLWNIINRDFEPNEDIKKFFKLNQYEIEQHFYLNVEEFKALKNKINRIKENK